MSTYLLISTILALAVLFTFINHRFIHLQNSIALMAGSLILSIILLCLQNYPPAHFVIPFKQSITHFNFHAFLLQGVLSFLLFAGSMTIDSTQLKSLWLEIGSLATLSTITSTLLIGYSSFILLPLFNIHLSLPACLLFGALISPTDPIAVLATFKEVGASKKMNAMIAGESLFNDGVGIVLFLTLLQLTTSGQTVTIRSVIVLFIQQVIGGVIYGLLLGYIANFFIKRSDHHLAILITLTITTAAYTQANSWGLSGPLAMVVAGIVIGNKLREDGLKQQQLLVTTFWEVIDEVLNSILFLLLGFELLTIPHALSNYRYTLFFIPIVLLVRLITVSIPIRLIKRLALPEPHTISILTWGGLRGGLAVALALSLPPSSYRNVILTMTFTVVTFSVLIQGTTIKALARLSAPFDKN